ncbi:hypothetical protein ACNOYE_06385 [Nannocystaceae bacterium ST9]
MPPLALAVVDAVFGLALHHDERGRRAKRPGFTRAHVRARLEGPRASDPIGALEFEVRVTHEPDPSGEGEVEEQRVGFTVDLLEQRILAAELSLAELPLDRSGLARLIGELETWCYDRVQV